MGSRRVTHPPARPLEGLLPVQQARRGAQAALPSHQPHPPHVPVLSHQPHHRHLGQLWQGEWDEPPTSQPIYLSLSVCDCPSSPARRATRWRCTWCGS